MTGLEALAAMKQAHEAVSGAAKTVERSGDPECATELSGLGARLRALEQRAQQEFATRGRRPVPAPTKKAGEWTVRMLASPQGRALAGGIAAPDELVGEAADIANRGALLAVWSAMTPAQRAEAAQQAQPTAGAFAGPGAAAAAARAAAAPVAGGGLSFGVKLGIGIGLIHQAATIGIAIYAAHEAKKAAPFDDADKPRSKRRSHDPGEVEDGAQQALDQAMPGARLSLAQAPGGRWVASVQRGLETVVRRSGRSAEEAAGDAVQAAVDTTLKADGDVIDADFVVLPKAAPAPAAVAG